ncbi:transcription factor bHLH162-like [Papaver somniferum]|uniref:transcription factor bHLH162-like n=1 Tax=Papaver somniferum TaxID=3469 RepID=UPI000E6F7CB6|nr:transcription factor bHLH162-like [Papaver somniferum]
MKSSSKGSSSASAAAIDRKTIEKNRRIHMKSLCFKLVSLIPPTTSTDHQNHSSKKDIPQTDLIDQAANYIQEQRKRIDKLKRKKDLLTTTWLPEYYKDFDSNTLEVVLITGMNEHFMYYQLITVLEEEGAEVVNASFATVNDKIFYTVHSQVRAGVETPRISDRLKKLVS